MSAIRFVIALCAGSILASCSLLSAPEPAEEPGLPVMRWDFRPEAEDWTRASLAALNSHGAALLAVEPDDIDTWCPAYLEAGASDRAAFWSGMFSALAEYESTWNPQAVGGGGRWFGLVQISPGTARGYGCTATSGQDLLDGPANLSCAIRIAAVTVTRDGVVAADRGGIAADWGPMLNGNKRAAMAEWTRNQSYCQP